MTDSNPNADVIAGLREVADFLTDHPELPVPAYASVSFRIAGDRSPARPTLTALARALGERATERTYSSEVSVDGRFAGNVRLSASAKLRELVDVPPEPEYEPIIKREAVV